jgi:Ca2+-binding RTX toxin-like protein
MSRVLVVLALVAAMVSAPAQAQAQQAPPDVVTDGNGIFQVHVQNAPGQGAPRGTFTITTGPDHPAGEGVNVLFGDGFPGTSAFAVRDTTDGVVYTNSDNPPPGAVQIEPVLLEFSDFDFPSQRNVMKAEYQTPRLNITQQVFILGTTLEDSTVQISTDVSGAAQTLEFSQLLDFRVDRDDGPTFQATDPQGPVITTESSFSPPAFGAFRVQNNDGEDPLAFEVDIDPSTGTFATLPVSVVDVLCWPDAFADIAGYTPDLGANRDVASPGSTCDPADGDSAVRLRWGGEFQEGFFKRLNTKINATEPGAATNPAATAIELTVDPSPSAVGQPTQLRATVTGETLPSGPPAGTVTFQDGAVVLGTAALDASGGAALTHSFATAGTHTLTATYNGGGGHDPSTSPPVKHLVEASTGSTNSTTVPGSTTSTTVPGSTTSTTLPGSTTSTTLPGSTTSTTITTPPTSTSSSTTSTTLPPGGDPCASPTLTGTGGDDTIMGTAGADVITGLGGNDAIFGLGGNDIVCGGDGNDTIDGGAGNDRIFGQGGDDRIVGGPGDDVLDGGVGADSVSGDAGNDELLGGDGDDSLRAGTGNDRSFGGEGDDAVTDGAGTDVLEGDAGDDTLRGGDGNDTLRGGDDDDRLLGEAGDDLLDGGPGANTLNGGAGVDSCGGSGTNTLNGCEGPIP